MRDGEPTWVCRKVNGADACLLGVTEREKSEGVESWKCERRACNFHVCIKCYEAEMLIKAILHSKSDTGHTARLQEAIQQCKCISVTLLSLVP